MKTDHVLLSQVNDLIQLFVRKPQPLSENTSLNIPSQVGAEDHKNDVKKVKVVAEVCDAVSEHVKVGQEGDSRETRGPSHQATQALCQNLQDPFACHS